MPSLWDKMKGNVKDAQKVLEKKVPKKKKKKIKTDFTITDAIKRMKRKKKQLMTLESKLGNKKP